MKKMRSKSRTPRVYAVLLAVILLVIAAPALAVDLTVKKACISMPDATVTDINLLTDICPAGTIKIWRFKRTDVAETTPVPPGGLVINATEGDNLTINVSNELGIPVSLVINGQVLSNNTGPVWINIADPYGVPTAIGSRPVGDVTSRVRSFAHEAPAGAVGTPGAVTAYTWNNIRTGTYIIMSGTHPSLQSPMGLYAALVVKTAGGEPYTGEPVPDNEQVLLFSEIDPAMHNAADDVTKTFPSTNAFFPKYFLINGKPFQGNNPLPIGATGETTLLRLLNPGVDTYMPLVQGPKITRIAEDGYLIPDALRLQPNAVELHSGKTVDVTMTNPASAGYIPVYDRRLFLSNATQTPGGMLAYLEIADAQNTLTVATNGGLGTGKVSAESMPGGIFCDSAILTSDCTQLYNGGTEIKLVPYANPGSIHTGWVVSPAADPADNCPNVADGSCIVTMNGAKTVTAAFVSQTVLNVITPNGGEIISAGSRYTIKWGAPANAVKFRLRYNNGKKWVLIANNVTGNTYSWVAPTPVSVKAKSAKPAAATFRIQVTGFDATGKETGTDASNTAFTVPALTIVSPAGGEFLSSGTGQVGYPIIWQTSLAKGLVKSIVIQYTTTGKKFLSVQTLSNADGAYDAGGTFNWQITPQVTANKPKSKVRIILKDAAGNAIGVADSKQFTITP